MKKEQNAGNELEIKMVDFHACNAEKKGPLRGFVTIKIGPVVLKGCQLLDMKDDGDYSIGFPQEKGKGKDGKDAYFRTAWIDAGSKEASIAIYKKIEEVVVNSIPG